LITDRTGTISDNGLPISGTGNFVQEGAGTIDITAANTLSGTTSVTAGTIDLQNRLRCKTAP